MVMEFIQILLLFHGLLLARAEVYLNCGTSISPVCYGENVLLVCVTDTMNGHLSWLNASDNKIVNLPLQAGEHRVKNGINFTLLENYGIMAPTERRVIISTAVLSKATTNTTIKCSDGTTAKACHIQIKKIFQPTWAIPTCTFSKGNVTLFWNPPSVGAECCKGYNITRDGERCQLPLMINQTHFTLNLKNKDETNITVYCVDEFDNPSAPSVPVLIQPKTDIESVFIEPLEVVSHTHTGRQLVEYLINWKTKKPMQSSEQMIICSPKEIHNTTIACSSESRSYPVHKDGFGYC